MEFIVEYWKTILALIIFVLFIATAICNLKRENLRQWLRWAVAKAEQDLGGGTGELKLRKVYDLAVTRFPWVGTIYPFSFFKKDVEEALTWFKKQLESNESVTNIIKNNDNILTF